MTAVDEILLQDTEDEMIIDDTNKEYNEEENWISDETVPEGWRYKGKIGSGFMLKSQHGVLFRSRRAAFESLSASGSNSEELRSMKSCLKYEGWEEREQLPRNWMMKPKTKTKRTQFMAQGGELFVSLKIAQNFVQRHHKYFHDDDITKLQTFYPGTKKKINPKTKSNKKPMKANDLLKWSKCDDSKPVPSDWFYKQETIRNRKFTRFLTSSGIQLMGTRSVLKFMSKRNYPEDQVNIIRNSLCTEEGWSFDKEFPNNWLLKRCGRAFNYISPDGDFFNSRESAKKYLNR